MLDLSLELGIMPRTLQRAMAESEFQQFRNYAARKMLPHRRLELYLAQIAKLIAQTMGGASDAKLSDFLFDPEDSSGDELAEAVEFFDFKPRQKAVST